MLKDAEKAEERERAAKEALAKAEEANKAEKEASDKKAKQKAFAEWMEESFGPDCPTDDDW